MLREFCDLSGIDITTDTKYYVTITKVEKDKDPELAMRELTIAPTIFVEVKKFIDSLQKV